MSVPFFHLIFFVPLDLHVDSAFRFLYLPACLSITINAFRSRGFASSQVIHRQHDYIDIDVNLIYKTWLDMHCYRILIAGNILDRHSRYCLNHSLSIFTMSTPAYTGLSPIHQWSWMTFLHYHLGNWTNLADTGLPSFSTVLQNSRYIFNKSWFACENDVVAHLRELSLVLVT